MRSRLPLMRAVANRAFAALLLLGATATAPVAAQAAPGPFAKFGGSWTGSGTIKLAGGTSERIRCKAIYVVEEGGNRLGQEMTCASDSYKLKVTSDLAYKQAAGVITGTWLEATYSTSGFVSGRATEREIKARVEGKNFYAEIGVLTNGNEQSVTIRPRAMDVEEVSVKLQRRAG